MGGRPLLSRREVLFGSAVVGFGSLARAAGLQQIGGSASTAETDQRAVNIVAGQNTALIMQDLMRTLGYMDEFGLRPNYVNVRDAASIADRLLTGQSDICALSGFGQLLPHIERGEPLKILAGGEIRPVTAVYSARPDIRTVEDLVGKTVGIGSPGMLLHLMMVALLRKKGIAEAQVQFVNVGSTLDVFEAVADKRVDAGPSTADYIDQQEHYGVHVLSDGALWTEVPEFTPNASYTTDHMIATKRDTLVRVLAAYAKTYRFIQSPGSRDVFVNARTRALGGGDTATAEGIAQWNFFQKTKPWAEDLVLSEERVRFFQELNIAMGVQKAMLPYEQVTDMSLARDALRLLG